MHFLRVLILDLHKLPLLFVFPEVLQMGEVTADTRTAQEEWDTKRAKTRPKHSLLHSLKYNEIMNMEHLENDNYQLQYNNVG